MQQLYRQAGGIYLKTRNYTCLFVVLFFIPYDKSIFILS